MRFVRGGLQQLYPLYLREDEVTAQQIRGMLDAAGVPIAPGEDRADRATPVPLELVFDLVNIVPVRDDDPGRWNMEVISAIIDSYRDQYRDSATSMCAGCRPKRNLTKGGSVADLAALKLLSFELPHQACPL